MSIHILLYLTLYVTICSSYYITKSSLVKIHKTYHHSLKVNTKVKNINENANILTINYLMNSNTNTENETIKNENENNVIKSLFPLFFIAITGIFTLSSASYAANVVNVIPIGLDSFNPMNFQPVCPASDGVYQFLKAFLTTLIGNENIAEYGPLIASVLLRVRLELCVFESFLYEAVVPFIRLKGLSWVLPLHETLETFIAGTVFAIASNFILLGSTKIFSILLIYIDALFGFPVRVIGSLLKRIPIGKPFTERSGQAMQLLGAVISTIRRAIESFDTFVGRYLVFGTSIYIAFKFLHFKFFNGLIPF